MTVAIILAGGLGRRVGADVPKQFIEIEGRTILSYTTGIFNDNAQIDAIQIVCRKEWANKITEEAAACNHNKVKWIANAGETYLDSAINGVMNLKDKMNSSDTAVMSFAVSPMMSQEDIDDSIRVCKLHGNGICAKDMSLCTCIKDNAESSVHGIARETIAGFANPWTFNYGELLSVYDIAIKQDMLKDIDPHTTSLYLAMGKRLWFSKCTASISKITTRQDVELFRGYVMLHTGEVLP